jgi:hypothetical protein
LLAGFPAGKPGRSGVWDAQIVATAMRETVWPPGSGRSRVLARLPLSSPVADPLRDVRSYVNLASAT